MPKISKFVLVSPASFYVRKLTYTCTACGRSFGLDVDTAVEELTALEREHVCQSEPIKTNTATFPLIRLLREQQAKAKKP